MKRTLIIIILFAFLRMDFVPFKLGDAKHKLMRVQGMRACINPNRLYYRVPGKVARIHLEAGRVSKINLRLTNYTYEKTKSLIEKKYKNGVEIDSNNSVWRIKRTPLKETYLYLTRDEHSVRIVLETLLRG